MSVFDDVDPFFDADEARAATWSPAIGDAAAGRVWLDAPDTDVLDDVVASDHSVVYRVSQWPTVRAGDRVTIDGVEYDVRGVRRLDDGLLARAALHRLG